MKGPSELTNKSYIGIDPGTTGAACLISPYEIKFYDWKDRESADMQLLQWNLDHGVYGVTIESPNVSIGRGCRLSPSLFKNLGEWLGLCQKQATRLREVAPKTWQSKTYVKLGKMKSKDKSILACHLYEPELGKVIRLKKHHNRADAYLIALYGKRYLFKGEK